MRRVSSLLLIVSILLAGTPQLTGSWVARAVAGSVSQSAQVGDPAVPQYPAVPLTEAASEAESEAGASAMSASATPSYAGHSGMSPYRLYQGRQRDEVFIADTGDKLDQYLFVNNSPLTFQLPITRHYGEVDGSGHLKNASAMISHGIIPDKALLFIRVFDVDNDYQGGDFAPERDILKLNGHVLYPTLSSGNNTWSTLTYRVPITYLKFPAPGTLDQAPTPAQNEISIDIDTSNGGQLVWAVEVDWAGLVLPAVRPAALVNGILSNFFPIGDTWTTFKPMLARDGLVSETVEVDALSGINTNASILLRELPRVKRKYGVERLNIIAHSKGGLDSRAYLRQRRDIDTLVQLGTPNRGSECAYALAGYAFAMTRNLQPAWLFQHFNYRQVGTSWVLNTPEQGAAPIYVIAGTARSSPYCTGSIGRFGLNGVGARLDPPNDGYVSADRATLPWRWTGVDNDGIDQGRVNGYIPVTHTEIHKRQSVADLAVQWLASNTKLMALAASTASVEATATESSASEVLDSMPEAASSPTYIDGIVGTLNDRQLVTLDVPVSGSAAAAFQVSFVDGDPSLEIVRPDGQVLTPTTAASLGGTYSTGEGFMYAKSYEIAAPQAGTWTLRLKGVGASSIFELVAGEDLAPTLEVATSTAQAAPGAPVVVTATLRDAAGGPVTGATVTARMLTPQQTQPALAFRDDGVAPDTSAGDGIYSTTTSGQTDGYYGLQIVAALPNGGRRMAATDFAVGGGSAQLVGNVVESGIDLDNDGLYDQLQADVDLQALDAGSYLVSADLVDSRNVTITTATSATPTINAGTAHVTLAFDGRLIYENGVNGPYRIANITLEREDGILLGSLPNDVNTRPYTYPSFQHERLRLAGTGSDTGVDTNGDGLFDRLEVRLGVAAELAGTHLVTARLMTGDGREVDWTEGYVYLQANSNDVTLVFDGQKIRRSGYTGSFTVTDLSIQGPSGGLIETDAYQTKSYAYSAFARIPTDLYVLPDDIQVNPDPAATGGRATISATIRNAGTAGGSFLVEFFLGNPEMGGTLIGTQTITQIAAEGAASTSIAWQAPTQPGSYLLYIRLNQSRALYEYDYSNNESWRSVAVTRQQSINAQVQLDPGVVQLGSQGRVVTAYIQLPAAYQPTAIQVATVSINDSIAALASPTGIVDQNRDGVPELMVKFDRSQLHSLVDSLLPPFVYRGAVDLNLSGALSDGTQFIGTTTIEVIRK